MREPKVGDKIVVTKVDDVSVEPTLTEIEGKLSPHDEWYFEEDYEGVPHITTTVNGEPITSICDSFNDVEDEEDYMPQSYSDFLTSHGGGKTLKDYTGVAITGESLKFESNADKDLKTITPQSLDFTETSPDIVNKPPHYNNGAMETIDIIQEIVGGYTDGFVAHCVGTATKYLSRAPHKHDSPTEDLEKARKYLDFAIEYLHENK